jgi:DUF971 family protein
VLNHQADQSHLQQEQVKVQHVAAAVKKQQSRQAEVQAVKRKATIISQQEEGN